jgi:hypothetical protein
VGDLGNLGIAEGPAMAREWFASWFTIESAATRSGSANMATRQTGKSPHPPTRGIPESRDAESLSIPRGRGSCTLPPRVCRQPRHHDLRRGPRRGTHCATSPYRHCGIRDHRK